MKESLLYRVPLFAGLPPSEVDTLAATLPAVEYSAGTILFHEGDYGDRFYIVLDGEIAIIKALDTVDERVLAMRGPGEFVGEMSLLSQDGLRTASARVHVDARLLELTRPEFDALLQRYPLLVYQMLRVLSDRLRSSHDAAIRELHEKNERLARAYTDLQAAQSQLIEQETLRRELSLAHDIQLSMLPLQLPAAEKFDLGACMVPARMVGGDFFDVIALERGRIGVAIGDVSGKGIPAALFMALCCSLLRAEARRSDSPQQVLLNLNRQLLEMNARGMFVTVLYGVLDQETGEFNYARAGHEPPLVLDEAAQILPTGAGRGMALGLFSYPIVDVQNIRLPSQGTLLLYTDGITEATDPTGSFFGLERLHAVLQARRATGGQELCDYLVDIVTAYQQSAPQADDITVVSVCARQ